MVLLEGICGEEKGVQSVRGIVCWEIVQGVIEEVVEELLSKGFVDIVEGWILKGGLPERVCRRVFLNRIVCRSK